MSRLPSVGFPLSSVPTHPLLIIDYARLTSPEISAADEESAKLFDACTSLGFFYLKNHPIDYEPLFEICQKVFELPEEEKARFDVGLSNSSFG